MKATRNVSSWIHGILLLAFLLGLAVAPAAADKETRYAFVTNQTSDILVLRYDETISGNKSMSAVQIYVGETKRLDTTKITSEVCAWDAREGSLQPAKKLDCRNLSPGDRWVIH